MNSQIEENLDRIRQAAFILGRASAQERTMALKRMAEALRENKEAVLAANEQDVMREKAAGLEKKRLGILTIASRDIDAMAGFFEQAASFKDPVGQVLRKTVPMDSTEASAFSLSVLSVSSMKRVRASLPTVPPYVSEAGTRCFCGEAVTPLKQTGFWQRSLKRRFGRPACQVRQLCWWKAAATR